MRRLDLAPPPFFTTLERSPVNWKLLPVIVAAGACLIAAIAAVVLFAASLISAMWMS